LLDQKVTKNQDKTKLLAHKLSHARCFVVPTLTEPSRNERLAPAGASLNDLCRKNETAGFTVRRSENPAVLGSGLREGS